MNISGKGNMDKIDAPMVKRLIQAEGIDLVGIADAHNLLLAYPPRPATALLPSARCVIVMAVAHSLGAVYAPHIMLWTRSKMQTSRLLDEIAEKIGRKENLAGVLRQAARNRSWSRQAGRREPPRRRLPDIRRWGCSSLMRLLP